MILNIHPETISTGSIIISNLSKTQFKLWNLKKFGLYSKFPYSLRKKPKKLHPLQASISMSNKKVLNPNLIARISKKFLEFKSLFPKISPFYNIIIYITFNLNIIYLFNKINKNIYIYNLIF